MKDYLSTIDSYIYNDITVVSYTIIKNRINRRMHKQKN